MDVATAPAPLPSEGDHPVALPAACTLAELLHAQDWARLQPIIDLGTAMVLLDLMDPVQVSQLRSRDPALLASHSPELVAQGLVPPDGLCHAHARVAGLPEVDVRRFDLGDDAWTLLPLPAARAHEVVPLGSAMEQFYVASWCPMLSDLRSELCSITGRTVRLVWADRDAIRARLDAQERLTRERANTPVPAAPTGTNGSGATAAGAPVPSAKPAPMVSLDDMVTDALVEVSAGSEQEQSASISQSSGVVRLVRKIIEDARRLGASDIHVETNPGEEITRVRLRRDGDLETYLQLPARLRASLVSRIKVMSRLDISERRRPQDGKINFADFGGDKLELRVAVMPTHDGLEDVVLRLLAASRPIPLGKLGFQPRDEDTVARLSARSFGLILAAGPTGSGKTTTLHSMLAEINTDERKIWTAEDPIEITQPGLRQVQVNPKIGLTFASAMRGFLRADPDVIMIGEIRDDETARIAIEASLTGHLVLSTLHTNSAAESVVRLLDLGMDPMNFADSLLGIVAQRLVRGLCPHCAQRNGIAPGHFDRLVREYVDRSCLSVDEGRSRLLQAAGAVGPDEIVIFSPVGCEQCGGRGYKGRVGIYEILENDPTVRSLIQNHGRPTELFDAAVRAGMRSLRHDALEKLVQGRIDLRQAMAAYR
jgi:type II secretory ATPase GspE/PulE/Tfp pilus assembly ATPase PilB-like protein